MIVNFTTLRLEVTPTDFVTFARCSECAALLPETATDKKIHTKFHASIERMEGATGGWRQGDDR